MDTSKLNVYINFDFGFMSLRSECIMELMPNLTLRGPIYTEVLCSLNGIVLLISFRVVFYLIIMKFRSLKLPY